MITYLTISATVFYVQVYFWVFSKKYILFGYAFFFLQDCHPLKSEELEVEVEYPQ